MTELLKVICAKLLKAGTVFILFEGTREECLAYMRKNGGRTPAKKYELMYSSGRLSSWVL